MIRFNTKPPERRGFAVLVQAQPRSLSDAAGYALAGALSIFFSGGLMAAAVVVVPPHEQRVLVDVCFGK